MSEEATAPATEPAPSTTGTPPPHRETTTGGDETKPPFGETTPPSTGNGGAPLELELERRTFAKVLPSAEVAVPRELVARAAVVHTLDAGQRRSIAAEFRALL